MMFQIRVNCACVDPLVPGADGIEAEMPNREFVGCTIDDELLQGARYIGLVLELICPACAASAIDEEQRAH